MSIGEPPRVLFCLGTERWLRAEAVEDLKRRCIAAGFEETDFVRFSDPDTEPQAILGAVQTAPFGSPLRLVVVDGLEEITPDSAPWLNDYLTQPNPRSCVVLCADRGGAALQRSAQVQILGCLPLKGPPLESWISERCRKKGKLIDARAVPELIRRIGSGLQGLDLALDSLVLKAGAAAGISQADVQALIPPSLHQTAFEILDLASAGRTGQAMQALREAMALGRMNMDQFFGALGWYLRHRLQGWPASRFQAALEDLLRADTRIKQGHPSPEWLADQLLLKLR